MKSFGNNSQASPFHRVARAGLALMLAVSAPGCAIKEILDVPDQKAMDALERSRVFRYSPDKVWAAVVKTLVSQGVSIKTQDRASGNIGTDWILMREAVGVFTTGARHQINVLVEDATGGAAKLTVGFRFEIRVTDKSNWQPTQRKMNQLDYEKKLFEAIAVTLGTPASPPPTHPSVRAPAEIPARVDGSPAAQPSAPVSAPTGQARELNGNARRSNSSGPPAANGRNRAAARSVAPLLNGAAAAPAVNASGVPNAKPTALSKPATVGSKPNPKSTLEL